MPPFRKDPSVHTRARLLLENHWKPDAVAVDARCSRATAWRWERNLAIYGETNIPRHLYKPGPSRSLSPAAKETLVKYQAEKPYLFLGLPRRVR